PGGSMMFAAEVVVASWLMMREKFGDRVYPRYGFVDSFNPNTDWVDSDVIGINVWVILLSAEHLRCGNVWRWFMKNAEIPRAMKKVGFVRYKARREPKTRLRKVA